MKKCPSCSGEIKSEAIKCRHCKEWLANVQPEDEKMKRERYARNNQPVVLMPPCPASQGKRLINWILDYLAMYGFVVVVQKLMFLFGFSDYWIEAVVVVFGILMPIIYYVCLESIWGKTIGKFITKTKVVMKDGTKPTPKNIIIRTFCRYIPFDPLTFLDPDKPVGWHDSFSRTIVKDDPYG